MLPGQTAEAVRHRRQRLEPPGREAERPRPDPERLGAERLDLLERRLVGPRGEECLAHRLGPEGEQDQRLDHVVDVHHRQRSRATPDLQADAAFHQSEEDQVLPISRPQNARRPGHRHLEARGPERDALGLGLALAVPLLGGEGVRLHVGPIRPRGPHRRERPGQHHPACPDPEHRVTHRASALGIDPEEGRALGGAAQPREVEDDLRPLDGAQDRPRLGHVPRHLLHPDPVEGRGVAPGTHQGPDPVPVSDQSPTSALPRKPFAPVIRTCMSEGPPRILRGEIALIACFLL